MQLSAPGTVRLVGKPHPLAEVIRAECVAGLTVAQILEGLDFNRLDVRVGGITLPRAAWYLVRPKVGQTLEVVGYPQGMSDNTKKTVSMIAMMVVMVAATVASQGATSALLAAHYSATTAALGGALAATAISVGGNLLIRALIKPNAPQNNGGLRAGGSTDRTYAITGSSNSSNPYGAVPCVFGTFRYFPTLAALPYSESTGEDQYVRFLFDLGYGTLETSDYKFGGVDMNTYAGVEYQIGQSPTLYSNDTAELSPAVAGPHPLNVGDPTREGATQSDTDEISVEILFQQGLFAADKDGGTRGTTTWFTVEWRQPGGAWANLTDLGAAVTRSGGLQQDGTRYKVKSLVRRPIRVSLGWKTGHVDADPANGVTGDPGLYEVRITRNEVFVDTIDTRGFQGAEDRSDIPTDSRFSDASWTTLRSVRWTKSSLLPTTKIAMKIKASDALNGSLNQFNLVVKQLIPVWTGGAWVVQASSNPAWQFHWLLTTCPGNPRQVAPSRLDFATIYAWAQECDTKGYGFNTVVDGTTTIAQLVGDLCAAGRATFTVRDGLYSVVRDVQQGAPIQHFTPRNSSDFQGSRAFPDAIHGLRCRFVNPAADWQQDEMVVYDDGYTEANATALETMEFRGKTDPNDVWKLARYHLANARLRGNEYTWKADLEHLVCNRGDMVKVSHDLMRWGLAYGQVAPQGLPNPNLAEPYPPELWTISGGATRVADNAAAPDGSLSADTFTLTSANRAFYDIPSPNDTYRAALWVRVVSGSPTLTLRLKDGFTDTIRASVAWVPTGTLWTLLECVGTTQSANATVKARLELAWSAGGVVEVCNPELVSLTRPLGLDYAPDNLLTFSDQFDNAAWGKNNATITANAAANPWGEVTADKLVETVTGTAVLHYTNRSVTALTKPNTVYTYSVFAKAGERTGLYFEAGNKAGGNMNSRFDLATGQIFQGSGHTATLEAWGNGWYRCAVALNTASGASSHGIAFMAMANAASGNPNGIGDGVSGLYLYGAQISEGGLKDPRRTDGTASPSLTELRSIALGENPDLPGRKNLVARVRTQTGASLTSGALLRDLTRRNAGTFARSGIAGTYRGADGLLKYAATNEPRYEYDGDGNYLGLLIESGKTQFFSSVTDLAFGAQWSRSLISLTPGFKAPDGNLTAYEMRASATTAGQHRLSQAGAVAVADNAEYTASIFVKAGTLKNFRIEGRTKDNNFPGYSFDLTTGTIMGQPAGTTRVDAALQGGWIEPWIDGWYRVGLWFSTKSGASWTDALAMFFTADATGNHQTAQALTDYLYVWGPNFTLGRVPTSYMNATGGRGVDILRYTLPQIPGFNPMEGTLVAEWDHPVLDSNGFNRVLEMSDGTNNNQFRWVSTGTPRRYAVEMYSGGAHQVSVTPTFPATQIVSGKFQRGVFAYRSKDIAYASEGVISKSGLGVLPVGMTKLDVGAAQNSSSNLDGHLRELHYLPARFTDAEIQAMSYVGAAIPDDRVLDLETPLDGVNEGDLVQLGETGQEAVNLIITRIAPSGDLTATLTAVDEAPAVYTADVGTMPPFTSQITGKVYEEPPEPPLIVAAFSTAVVQNADDAGTTKPELRIRVERSREKLDKNEGRTWSEP